MELPQYRITTLKSVLIHGWEKVKGFAVKAGTVIFASTVLIWFLSSFNFSGMCEMEDSLLASIGNAIKWIFVPLGFGDWRASVGVVTGWIAKENIVATFGQLFGGASDEMIEAVMAGEEALPAIGEVFTRVSAYSYMALVPVIQPPIMRLLTTKNERIIRMKPPRAVSHTEKVIFPIIGLLLTCFLVPSGLPLVGMLFFGNLLKESGVTRRLANTASGPLIDTITILLGLTVGASTQASEFLTFDSIKIFALGALSFVIATTSGVIFVKIFNLFLKKDNKINPLIGNAGVSAVPDSARISQVIGLEYDSTNYLLMHAMGPNVAGVIGSAVAAGILLGFLM